MSSQEVSEAAPNFFEEAINSQVSFIVAMT